MTDNELDAILKEIEKKANEKVHNASDEPVKREEPAVEPIKSEPVYEAPIEQPKREEAAADEQEELKLTEVESNEESEFVDLSNSYDISSAEQETEYEEETTADNGRSKKIIAIVIAVIAVIAIGVGVYFGFFNKKPEEPTTAKPTQTQQNSVVAEDKGAMNPLTGEYGFNENAVGKRPVAVVVENEYSTESVRPQWGLKEADIVLEGESEFSTRLLLFYADYTNVPKQVGPARSARPPFIRFSQLFDAPFIHAGLSHSKGNYVGADTVFTSEGVDHYNLLSGSEGGRFFDRDKSRTSTVEHTGYLKGENVKTLFEAKEWRTDINENKFSVLSFNDEATELSETPALNLEFRWSGADGSGRCPKTGHFSYDTQKKAYTTTDFDSRYGTADSEFANLVFLLDKTEYIVKDNYKNSGSSETYCDYKLSGGKGVVASMGTQIEITWGVENGKLWMKDSNGADVKLNAGKTYIGYGSSNHGGSIKTVTETE